MEQLRSAVRELQSDLTKLTEVERLKMRAIAVAAATALAILVVLGVIFFVQASNTREQAELNGEILERLEKNHVRLICYASTLGDAPPPEDVVCPNS